MEYKKIVAGVQTDRSFPAKNQKLNLGDYIEGRYVEVNEKVGPNNSMMYILEVGNEKVGVWGSTVIDNKMKKIAIGKMVKIEYAGEQKSEKTGRTYNDYEIYEGIDTAGDEGSDIKVEDLPF